MDEVTTPIFPWEKEEPLHAVFGFVMGGPFFRLYYGYAIYPGGVLLYCHELLVQVGKLQPWRRYFTSREGALEIAEDLLADSEEYLESLGIVLRPTEDLGPDDFLFHLHARLNNELH